ncbi:MAG: hypothetical protein ACKN9V_03060 [Pseudomonadota bacterium]
MNKLVFQAELPTSLKKDLETSISKEFKKNKARSKKSQEKEMIYQPGKMSPLNYLVLKVLDSQFGERSHPALPIVLGIARKGLSQVKRLLSHGSL